METKRIASFLKFAIILLLLAMPVFADEISFPQKLEWKSNANALEYKVEVQNIATGKTQVLTTDKTFTEISLMPGKYRYRISAYDFLGKKASVSSWTNFEVFKANKPKIKDVEPSVKVQEETGSVGIDVNISDINKDTKFELVNESLEGVIPIEEKSLMGTSSSETEKVTHLDFKNVPPGKWRLRVTNASGLSSLSEVIEIEGEKKYSEEEVEKIKKEAEDAVRSEMQAQVEEYKKNAEAEKLAAEKAKAEEEKRLAEEERLRIEEEKRRAEEDERLAKELLERQKREAKEAEKKAKKEWKAAHPYKWKNVIVEGGLAYSMNILGDTIKDYYEEKNVIALNARVKFLPVKIRNEQIGAEIGFLRQEFKKDNSYLTAKLESNIIDAKIVCQHRVMENVFVAGKLGGGVDMVTKSIDYSASAPNRLPPDKKNYFYPAAVAGASVFFTPWKFVVAEIGADFTYVLAGSSPLGFVSPYACIGFRF